MYVTMTLIELFSCCCIAAVWVCSEIRAAADRSWKRRAWPGSDVSALEPVSVFKRAHSSVRASNAFTGTRVWIMPAVRWQISLVLRFPLICVDINKPSPEFHHLCGAFRRQNAARFTRRGKLFQLVGILIPMSSSDALLLLLGFSRTDAARGSITVSRVAWRCAQWVERRARQFEDTGDLDTSARASFGSSG